LPKPGKPERPDPAAECGARRIRPLRIAPAAVALAALLLLPTRLPGQSGGGHILFGDLKVDERRAPALGPQTFQVILTTLAGDIVARQTVAANGRYRFLDVRNGDYYLVVEADNQEVARVQLLIMEAVKTDIRRDLELTWQRQPGQEKAPLAGGAAARETYARSPGQAALLEKALKASGEKEYRKALDLLQEIVAADPRDFEAWTEMGTVSFQMRDYGEAEKSYRRALQENPSYVLALRNLGKLLFEKKDYQGAIPVLTKASGQSPPSAEIYRLLGECYLGIKKGSTAEGLLKKALELDPQGQADAHLRLAALYNAAGYKNLAAEQYEQFLAKRPDFPERKKLEEYIRRNKP